MLVSAVVGLALWWALVSRDAGSSAVLRDDLIAASCIDGADDAAHLCYVDTRGRVDVTGALLDPGSLLALSPDRRRIAHITDGKAVIASVEGAPLDTGHPAAQVEWLDDSSLIVLDESHEVTVVDIETRARWEWCANRLVEGDIKEIRVAARRKVAAVVVQPADDPAVVQVLRSDTCSRIDLIDASDVVVQAIALSPEGNELAVSTGTALLLFELGSGRAEGVTRALDGGGATVLSPTFSPSGDQLVYVDSRGALFLADLETKQSRAIVDQTAESELRRFPVLPEWS